MPRKSQTSTESFRSLLSILALGFFVRFFVLSPFVIPSGSMIPSMLVGDFLFVTPFSYGFSKLTLPFGYYLPGLKGRIFQFQEPTPGKPIVFRPTDNPKIDYVKRLIAVPGETVQLKDGYLFINGKKCPVQRVGLYEERAEEGGRFIYGTVYKQTLPNGAIRPFLKQQPFGAAPYDNTPALTVPKNHYFVMGDNHDGSLDSRAMHAIGFVHRDNIIGTPLITFFSLDGRARFWQVWKWPTSLRLSRFFKLLC